MLNITECVDCLDNERTTWNTVKRGDKDVPVCIRSYAFRQERLSESPLFKIPEECVGSIFLTEGLMEPEEEFREIVRQRPGGVEV